MGFNSAFIGFKTHGICLAFKDITSTLNPLEVINTDVTYSGPDLRHTQLGDLIGPLFIQCER
jgi:hypothetical protein